MKKYINTSNYYLSTIASVIESNTNQGSFDVADTSVDGVQLPTQGYYWVDVDFGDVSKREIFRIVSRNGYTLTYDARISPYGMKRHAIGATVGLRDFSQLLNSLSTNTDNFGEVEKVGAEADRGIKVRGGKIFASGNALKLYDTVDTTFTVPINSEKYIVLDYEMSDDGIDIAAFTMVDEEDLTATGKYPIAKITTNATMITDIEDLRANLIYGGGEGDMKAEFYDPDDKKVNVYKMDNMEQGEVNQYVSPVEKQIWSDKQEQLIGIGPGQNIHTIQGQSILGPGNFSIDTVLTVGWAYEVTSEGAASYQISAEHRPLNENAFMIITDSGTFLVLNVDYTYNDVNRTITFTNPLASTEKAYIWVMYQTSDEQATVGSADVTLKWGEGASEKVTFNVNQTEDMTLDIGAAANDTTITVTQGGISDQTFSTNQATASDINLSGIVPVTEQGYEDAGDEKLTDNNWYLIYE